jgi:uncharacterized protein YehS (DUF1456 family)
MSRILDILDIFQALKYAVAKGEADALLRILACRRFLPQGKFNLYLFLFSPLMGAVWQQAVPI